MSWLEPIDIVILSKRWLASEKAEVSPTSSDNKACLGQQVLPLNRRNLYKSVVYLQLSVSQITDYRLNLELANVRK